MLGIIHELDLAIVRFVTTPAGRYPVFDRVFGVIHGSLILKAGVLVAILCWLWVEAMRTGAEAQRRVSRMVLATFAAIAVGRSLQALAPRSERPIAELASVTFPGNATDNLADWNSFPSDHAVYLVALSTTFFFRSRALGTAALLWEMAIGVLPRMYYGEHWPSDIFVGTAIGLSVALLVMRLPLSARLLDLPWRFAERFPAPFMAAAAIVVVQMSTMFSEARHWVERIGIVAKLLTGIS